MADERDALGDERRTHSLFCEAVRALFGPTRKRAELDYDTAIEEMSSHNDSTAKAARSMASAGLLKPATAPGTPLGFPNRSTGPE